MSNENPQYSVLDLERKEQIIQRIKAFEIELSAELNTPVALIAYAPEDNTK